MSSRDVESTGDVLALVGKLVLLTVGFIAFALITSGLVIGWWLFG
jgi:hypothetical protein